MAMASTLVEGRFILISLVGKDGDFR